MKKIFIENCFCLTDKRVGKSLSMLITSIDHNNDFERPDILYDYNDSNIVPILTVTVGKNIPEVINYDPFETTYGQRNYFICNGCGTRHTKLYLKPHGHIFRCKDCFALKYETFNPSSAQGRFLKQVKKVLKLVQRQAEMTSRIWYRDVYTKRYSKFLDDCLKAGLTDVVDEARALEAAIKANELKNKTNAVN